MAKKKRRKVIKTPRRHPADTEVEHLEACVLAAAAQIDQAREKVDDLTSKLCRAWAHLREVQAGAARYAARLERARAGIGKLGRIRGEGSGLQCIGRQLP